MDDRYDLTDATADFILTPGHDPTLRAMTPRAWQWIADNLRDYPVCEHGAVAFLASDKRKVLRAIERAGLTVREGE